MFFQFRRMVRGVRLGPTRVRSHRVRLRGLYSQRVRTFGSRIIFATPLGRESIFSESALHRPMFLQITCAVPENGATDGAPIREVSQKTKKTTSPAKKTLRLPRLFDFSFCCHLSNETSKTFSFGRFRRKFGYIFLVVGLLAQSIFPL